MTRGLSHHPQQNANHPRRGRVSSLQPGDGCPKAHSTPFVKELENRALPRRSYYTTTDMLRFLNECVRSPANQRPDATLKVAHREIQQGLVPSSALFIVAMINLNRKHSY